MDKEQDTEINKNETKDVAKSVNKRKYTIIGIILIAIPLIAVAFLGKSYYKWTQLDVYTKPDSTSIVSKSGAKYMIDMISTQSIVGGDSSIVAGETIGRIKGVGYLQSEISGPVVVAIKGEDSSESVLLLESMSNEVMTK